MTLEEKAKQKAEEIEKNQTLGVYDNEEDLIRDSSFNDGIVEGYEEGYLDGAKENGVVWHDLRKDPNDLPKVVTEYITNIGVMTFDRLKDRHLWTTPICDACDYCEEVTDEVIAWCEIPTFKE